MREAVLALQCLKYSGSQAMQSMPINITKTFSDIEIFEWDIATQTTILDYWQFSNVGQNHICATQISV